MSVLFGWKLDKGKEQRENDEQDFIFPEFDDGSSIISSKANFGSQTNMDNTFESEQALIQRYRQMILHPEVEMAVDEIINESIITGRNAKSIWVELDGVEGISEKMKDAIKKEFDSILDLLGFNYNSYELFKKWYIDGRLYFFIKIDQKNPSKGIQELKPIDPLKIKKVRELKENEESYVQFENEYLKINRKYNEFFLYSENGVFNSFDTSVTSSQRNTIIKLAPDSIAEISSGLLDDKRKIIISYLHKAFKPLNQLRMLEDSAVIYRLSRAPERRVFNIDVGNLPNNKAEQYIHSIMNRYRNKITYNGKTGEVQNGRHIQTILEDFWFPKRDGSKGTDVTTLPGGASNLSQLEEIEYFQKQLFRSLYVPISRLIPDSGFSLGRASEISREEYKFIKFIERLRTRFSYLFLDLLEKQLKLKNIVNEKYWEKIKDDIYFQFEQDSNFAEQKNLELMGERISALRDIEEFRGRYFSSNFIQKNILNMSDDEIERIEKEIENDKYDSRFVSNDNQQEGGYGGGFGGSNDFSDGGMGQMGQMDPSSPPMNDEPMEPEPPDQSGMVNDLEQEPK